MAKTDKGAKAAGAQVDRLYGLPRDRFIEERDELAKRVRREGRRAEADEIKALKKPNAAAWTVNQRLNAESSS